MLFDKGKGPYLDWLNAYLDAEVKAGALAVPDIPNTSRAFLATIAGQVFWPELVVPGCGGTDADVRGRRRPGRRHDARHLRNGQGPRQGFEYGLAPFRATVRNDPNLAQPRRLRPALRQRSAWPLCPSYLPEAHRARETIETMQLMIGMLVTFAALVLGLLTASVKAEYDSAMRDRQDYALQLTQFDQCLRNYGPGAEAARTLLRQIRPP